MRRVAGIVLIGLCVGLAGLPAIGAEDAVEQPGGDAGAFRVLVFSRTTGFRHGSIPVGVAALQKLGADHGFAVDATEDPAVFTDAALASYATVVFLSTTGDVLDATQQSAFERYIKAGGGYVGIHAAADTEYDWAYYQQLMGAYFDSHPAIQQATVNVDDRVHPSTAPLPARWQRTDEWYNYQTNPRGSVHVLATLDESTYSNGGMGIDHPIAWCHDFDGGRSWYTGMGHTNESFSEPAFLAHVLGGIQSTAGVVGADCGATLDANYTKEPIDTETLKPIRLQVAPDGRVFYLEQAGQVKIYNPATRAITVAADFVAERNIFNLFENGTVGLAFDPDFVSNGWLYLYYSPGQTMPCPATEAPTATCGEVFLSRFTVVGDKLDLSSEKVLLKVAHQRDTCCHTTGDMVFDSKGNLYLSTGDDTNPWESSGYTPIDERAGRQSRDAQRTSANTNDLRGKILRIHPEDDGTYTIPQGNLFAPGTAQTRPEIYAMGLRNPFTIDIDPATDALIVADYGPDSTISNPVRGPEGRVELNYMTEAGNYGWPYCIAENTPYIDFTFVARLFVDVGAGALPFDCANPVNNSPNNTGLTQLPPAKPSTLYQSISQNSAAPHALGWGSSPMTGPFVDAAKTGDGALPAYFDKTQLWMDWNRGELYEIKRDDARTISTINRFLKTFSFKRPIEMDQAPDGSLYLAEWGLEQFFGPNTDSGVYRISYNN